MKHKHAELMLQYALEDLKERNARLEAALRGLMEITAAAYGDQVNQCAQYRVAKDALNATSD